MNVLSSSFLKQGYILFVKGRVLGERFRDKKSKQNARRGRGKGWRKGGRETSNSFVNRFQDLLASLTETEFQNYVSSISAELLEADKTLGQETNRYWREISNECYVFDRGKYG